MALCNLDASQGCRLGPDQPAAILQAPLGLESVLPDSQNRLESKYSHFYAQPSPSEA